MDLVQHSIMSMRSIRERKKPFTDGDEKVMGNFYSFSDFPSGISGTSGSGVFGELCAI